MRSLTFGSLRFDRRSIPVALVDISQWPTADDSALDDDARALFERRMRAIALFVDGSTPLREIGRETRVRINDLYRLFERCVALHADGRIYGCRALLPYLHTRPYQRQVPVTGSRVHSASGAFDQLLRRYPDISRWIERKVTARSRRIVKLEEVPRQLWRLHASFLAQCRQAGIPPHEYPFNQKHLGERSLASHVRRLANRQFGTAARIAGAQQIGHRWNADPGDVRKVAAFPYEVVESTGTGSMSASLCASTIRSASKHFWYCTGSGFWSFLMWQAALSSATPSRPVVSTTATMSRRHCRPR